MLSLWNFCSFMMRIVLTGRPMSVFLSFRSLIELATTYPFMISMFIENGQYLYGMLIIGVVEKWYIDILPFYTVPYFLRSWVLLLRIKSVLKIKTNLLMTGTYKKKTTLFDYNRLNPSNQINLSIH